MNNEEWILKNGKIKKERKKESKKNGKRINKIR